MEILLEDMFGDLVTVSQARRLYGCRVNTTIYDHIKRGNLPGYYYKRLIHVRKSELKTLNKYLGTPSRRVPSLPRPGTTELRCEKLSISLSKSNRRTVIKLAHFTKRSVSRVISDLIESYGAQLITDQIRDLESFHLAT